MMNRMIVGAALAIGGAISSGALAGFTVTTAQTGSVIINGTAFDRWDITAVNTGGDTGTQIKGLEYFYTGARVYFQVDDLTDATGEGDPDHFPDTVNLLSPTRTRVRVSNTASANVFVGVQPGLDAAQFNPYMVGRHAFSGAIANTGTTQATGTGFQIARLYLLPFTGGYLSGNIGGDMGSKVPFSMGAGPLSSPPLSIPPSIDSISAEPVVAQFGSVVSTGAPFSVTIRATDPEVGDIMSMIVTPVEGIRNLTITGGGTGTQDFIVTGVVDYSRLYVPLIVPFTVRDRIGSGSIDSFCVFAVPEPSSIAVLGLGGMVLRRCRRG